jgi:histidyl-tRNA synthetase
MKKTPQNKLQEISSPKGMRDLMNEEYYSFQGFFEKAQEVAVYYGFKPIETPILENEEIFTAGIGFGTDIGKRRYFQCRHRRRNGYYRQRNVHVKN